MSWYRTGTVAVTNGKDAVTGTGTSWVDNTEVGESFLGPDARVYEILARNSDTSLKIAPAYLGATAAGQAYAILPTQSYLRDLAAQAANLINTYADIKAASAASGAGKFQDGTVAAPGVSFVADPDTGLRRTGANALALVTGGVDRLTVSSTGAIGGVTKAHVGLDKADNTADSAKPVSTAQQAAIDGKIGHVTNPSTTDWDTVLTNGLYSLYVGDDKAAAAHLPVLAGGSVSASAYWIISVVGSSIQSGGMLQRAFNVNNGTQAGRCFLRRRYSGTWGPWVEQPRLSEVNGATALPPGAAIATHKILTIGDAAKTFDGTATSVHGASVVMRIPSSMLVGYMFHAQPTVGDGATDQTMNTLVQFGAYQPLLQPNAKVSVYYGHYAQYIDTPGVNTAYAFYGSMGNIEGCSRWNFYAHGQAPNYFAGDVVIGNNVPNGVDKLRTVGAVQSSGPAKHGQYTLTTLPSAATYNGYLIDVTNATGGVKTCRSDGTAWKILNTTTMVS